MQAMQMSGQCIFAPVRLSLYHYIYIYEEKNVAPKCSVDLLCLLSGSVCRVSRTDFPVAGGSQ